jgi:hypothetical protein
LGLAWKKHSNYFWKRTKSLADWVFDFFSDIERSRLRNQRMSKRKNPPHDCHRSTKLATTNGPRPPLAVRDNAHTLECPPYPELGGCNPEPQAIGSQDQDRMREKASDRGGTVIEL